MRPDVKEDEKVDKKPTLCRVPLPLYDLLLKEAARRGMDRGRQISVPALMVDLCLERLNDLKDKEGA